MGSDPSGVLYILEQLQTGMDEGGITSLLGCDICSAFDILPEKQY